MTPHQLARLLAAIVALPGLAAVGVACSSCPYTEVVKAKDIPLDQAAACQRATAIYQTSNVPPESCATACGDTAFNVCFLDQAYVQAFFDANSQQGAGGSGGGGGGGSGGVGKTVCPILTGTLTCQVIETHGEFGPGCPIDGRRPAGLVEPRVEGSVIGSYLATAAHLEAASIVAFKILHAELERLGAPRSLLDDVLSAEADEVRHTAVMTRLAAKYGALVPEPEVASSGPRAVPAIAIENAVEGVVREAFGAAVALFQANHAADPAIRAAMQVIADDECAHASLAFRAAGFLDQHLGAAERERVEASKQEAMRDLFASLVEPDAALRRLAGLPSVDESRQILEGMVITLWSAPLAA